MSTSYSPAPNGINGYPNHDHPSHASSSSGAEYDSVPPPPVTNATNGVASHESQNLNDTSLINHLYHAGFQMGNYADTILHIHGRQYRLHAIVLARSPYLVHLMSTSPSSANTSLRNVHVPIEEIPEVTEEGFAIALGYLYSAMSLNLINPQNARAVLASACLLGGLPDLAEYAYTACRQSIAVETLDDWLRFIESIPSDPQDEPQSVEQSSVSVFGPYAHKLRADMMQFLVVVLPQRLDAFGPESSRGPGGGLDSLLRVYARVPFDIFKYAIEAQDFPIGSDQARFQFAKAAVALRKSGVGRGADEAVVLAFGSGASSSGSAVHVTRKVKKRHLWKVTK